MYISALGPHIKQNRAHLSKHNTNYGTNICGKNLIKFLLGVRLASSTRTTANKTNWSPSGWSIPWVVLFVFSVLSSFNILLRKRQREVILFSFFLLTMSWVSLWSVVVAFLLARIQMAEYRIDASPCILLSTR